ncbi:hypothetical protein DWX58_12765 [Pseudoflavonifractor sp. AF19-9AC]|uniref:Rossmann-like domain-containing protein n=1 Tax=Pseudoflavonifractor sp. AF19-9AC TaxID=2292244 RepID=UPI000E4B9ACE|nr:DUF364 domain-containing protein [Pseudoflavonifractor sp. AF19-9AC]RHR06813.1 hypothetical protein DWX58_12765 [Pseudoflavonifractor sp. AF19-9AC]
MTAETFYTTLKSAFEATLAEHHIGDEAVEVTCRALSPEEAIGSTVRRDFPILTGKDVMIQARFRSSLGQAFTQAPLAFQGSLSQVLAADLVGDPHARGLYIATLNAVTRELGLCEGTVHCRTQGPELCAGDMLTYLRTHYPEKQRIALVGYQPALLEMLSKSEYQVRVLDLNPDNVGQVRFGVTVEDGVRDYKSVALEYADLILCTGSTICNGTITDYLELSTPVVFFGTTISGAAALLGLKRACFAQQYG